MSHLIEAQWVFYLFREFNFDTFDAQEFIKTEKNFVSISPPPITKFTQDEIHRSRCSVEEAHGEGLVIYLSH